MNHEAYTKWKSELVERGKTPSDVVRLFRTLGQDEYADQLEALIQEMEALHSEPA